MRHEPTSTTCPPLTRFNAALSAALGLSLACKLPEDPTPPDYTPLPGSAALEDCDGQAPPGALRATHVGTATLLLEIGPFRLITDPALDAAGEEYSFGWGTHSRKLLDPEPSNAQIQDMRFDAALITHDRHADNLDESGRRLLETVGVTITTRKGARRLGGRSVGLDP